MKTICKNYLKNATNRLRAQNTLQDASERLIHCLKESLRRHPDPVLSARRMDAIEMIKYDVNNVPASKQPMDRRRAQEQTAQILAGKSHAALLNDIDKREADEQRKIESAGKFDLNKIGNTGVKMVNFAHAIKFYPSMRTMMEKRLFEDLAWMADHESPLMDDENQTFEALAATLNKDFKGHDVHFEASGLSDSVANCHGKKKYTVCLRITANEHTLQVDFDYVTSEYEGFSVESINFEYNGVDINFDMSEPQGASAPFINWLRLFVESNDNDVLNPHSLENQQFTADTIAFCMSQ
jgi:hypothetical protein